MKLYFNYWNFYTSVNKVNLGLNGRKMNQMQIEDGTVGKALLVLDIVAEFDRGARFNDILERSPFPKATTYRMLQTLVSQRMLGFDEATQKYQMGLRLVRLAHKSWAQSSLAPLARPTMDALATETAETVHLAQLDHSQVLYVDKRSARLPVEMYSNAGKVAPAYCTGIGKAMLAALPEKARKIAVSQQSFYAYTASTLPTPAALEAEIETIQNQGIAFDREEHEDGIICIAAPIVSSKGNLLGGLSITSTTERHSVDTLIEFKRLLLNAAQSIAVATESWQFPK